MDDRIQLDEFCKDLSTTDKRVELIAGFHYWMSKDQKITKATKSFFETAFNRFSKMPA